MRIRYDVELSGLRAAILCDVFNLLGSGTEMLEDPRTGDQYRRSLEMMPGRGLRLGVEAGWK